MDILGTYERQLKSALESFRDIVADGIIFYSEIGEPLKLRLDIIDGSVIGMTGVYVVSIILAFEVCGMAAAGRPIPYTGQAHCLTDTFGEDSDLIIMF